MCYGVDPGTTYETNGENAMLCVTSNVPHENLIRHMRRWKKVLFLLCPSNENSFRDIDILYFNTPSNGKMPFFENEDFNLMAAFFAPCSLDFHVSLFCSCLHTHTATHPPIQSVSNFTWLHILDYEGIHSWPSKNNRKKLNWTEKCMCGYRLTI